MEKTITINWSDVDPEDLSRPLIKSTVLPTNIDIESAREIERLIRDLAYEKFMLAWANNRLREEEVEARNDAYKWRKIAAIIMDDCIPKGHKDFYLDQFCNKYPNLAKVFIND